MVFCNVRLLIRDLLFFEKNEEEKEEEEEEQMSYILSLVMM